MDPRARLPRRLQRRCLIIVLALLALPLSGCLGDDGAPEESTQPTPSGNVTAPTPGANESGEGAFLIEGLELRANGSDAPATVFHEDDVVEARYTVRHPGSPGKAITRFVTFVVNGEVEDVQQLRLEPDGSRDYTQPLGSMRGRERLDVEVRVAPSAARVNATVEEWPRTGEETRLGNLTLRVHRWLKDADGSTLVNVTFRMPSAGAENLTEARAKIICADEAGTITLGGDARPPMPAPGEGGVQDVRLPGCPHTLYGVRFKADEGGREVEKRILFVDRGWAPADAS